MEGSAKSEKNPRFADTQQPRSAMAGTQRYLRYIIFAIVVWLTLELLVAYHSHPAVPYPPLLHIFFLERPLGELAGLHLA